MHLLVLSAFRHDKTVLAGGELRVSMHLLVLSAFRQIRVRGRSRVIIESQCTFWCSVLSDPHHHWHPPHPCESQCTFWCSVLSDRVTRKHSELVCILSQCTFWCSVLSDIISDAGGLLGGCLNAPFGAQCFPTLRPLGGERSLLRVSMHLLVLSAFRPGWLPGQTFGPGLVSMHLLVLSAFRHEQIDSEMDILRSQCTFWCSVLSDVCPGAERVPQIPVSMHLLVLSAFRRGTSLDSSFRFSRLNAPFGAQCFPTSHGPNHVWDN